MRRIAALAAVFSMVLISTPLFAAPIAGGRAAMRAQGAQTGTINGTAQGSQGQTLANFTVRVRNVDTGQLAGSTTSNTAGSFSVTGLSPANYVVEVVDNLGNVVGTSSSLALTAGTTLSVTVGATALAASAVAAAGGTAFLASTAGIVTVVAGAAGVAGIVAAANKGSSSPSR